MAYQLRVESNAFKADSIIGKMLDVLDATAKKAKRLAGANVRQDEVNKLLKLRGINTRVFERAMDWADADFDQQMLDEKWDWKGPEGRTRRKNGESVTEPRNIVDTGSLMQSKRREVVNSSVTEFIWDDKVAELVHDGGKTKKGDLYPARPWTEETLKDIDTVISSLYGQEGR